MVSNWTCASGAPKTSTVVLDKVQRVPELLNVVHALIESKERRRFVLTGSSARKLRRGGVDLLAGRAVLRTLHPFMAAELRDFDLEAGRGPARAEPVDRRHHQAALRKLTSYRMALNAA
ncbi:MAG: AAA family ATPase [Luteitalea sp.]|nr:AAA family ATPase [Luteitalea sp.]